MNATVILAFSGNFPVLQATRRDKCKQQPDKRICDNDRHGSGDSENLKLGTILESHPLGVVGENLESMFTRGSRKISSLIKLWASASRLGKPSTSLFSTITTLDFQYILPNSRGLEVYSALDIVRPYFPRLL